MNLLEKILTKKIKRDGDSITTFLNPYSYLIARRHPELYSEFDNLCVDGILLVIALRFIGFKVTRESFDMSSLAPRVLEYCQTESKSIYFIGSTQENIERYSHKIQMAYPELIISGFRNGYFTSEFEKDLAITDIKTKNPDFVIVGMGTPYQDFFLKSLKDLGWKGVGYTCGGFFHQTAAAQGTNYYPRIIDKLQLRWMYRIYSEPKLFFRYTVYYPLFLIFFAYDYLCIKLKKNS